MTIDTGLDPLIKYIQGIINLIVADTLGTKDSDGKPLPGRNDPWCSGYYNSGGCCDDYEEGTCDKKHPLVDFFKLVTIGVIVLMAGALTFRVYNMIKYIFG